MHQIVYVSRATRRYDEMALQGLCERSASNNRSRAVTGLLLYDGTQFIQALEGEEVAVRQTMARIAADPGHEHIEFMADAPVAARQFGDWSMDYKLAPSGCCSQAFLATVKADVAAVADPALRAAFIGFASLGSSGDAGYRCDAR